MAMNNEPPAMAFLVIYSDRAEWPSFAGMEEPTVKHKSAMTAYAERVPVGAIREHQRQAIPDKPEILNCVLGVFRG